MSKIADKTFKRFLSELGSKSPTPGGGAVAAMSGAMAASLVEMVCNLTIGKAKYKSSEKVLIGILKKSSKHKAKLLKLADLDVAAFDKVMKAYKSKSKPLIKKALRSATEVPLKVAVLTKEIQRFAEITTKKGNKNAYSDSKTALHLAKAAYNSAMENVKINRKFLASL